MDDKSNRYYELLKKKDKGSDGRFFVGVSSTGIYCRPICKAKLPKAENCSFFKSAAEAQQAGFRPCLLCRPELAPGSPPGEVKSALARRAAKMIEENCNKSSQDIMELILHLGCTAEELSQVFDAEYSVSPVQYLQTCRLLLAKNLLTDTGLSIDEVAASSGFDSSSHLLELFKKTYRLEAPSLRRKKGYIDSQNGSITLLLCYRPPYLWQQMLDFLSPRAIPGVEAVREGEYLRTVHFEAPNGRRIYGTVKVGHVQKKCALSLTLDYDLLSVLPAVMARTRHLFDLNCDPYSVYEVLSSMNDIRPGLCVLGSRLPGGFDAFEMTVRAVLGQQITIKAARTLTARFVEAFGTPVQSGMEGLTHAFPPPECIAALDGSIEDSLGRIGITRTRSNTILALAKAFLKREIDFDTCGNPKKEIQKLMDIRGIGPWTAQYIAMRCMGWPDAFPHTDYGVKKALSPRTPKEILNLAEAWRPWRGYGTINLWNSLRE